MQSSFWLRTALSSTIDRQLKSGDTKTETGARAQQHNTSVSFACTLQCVCLDYVLSAEAPFALFLFPIAPAILVKCRPGNSGD